MRTTIFSKIVILITTILVLAMGTNTVVNIVQFEKNYRYALQTKVIAVGENLENMLQNTLSLGFPLGNLPGLNEKCKNIVGQYTEISDCYITDTDIEVIYHNNSSFVGKILRGKQKALRETSIRLIFLVGEKFYEICVPILHQKSELLGTIRLAVPVEFIQSKTRRVLLNSVFLLIALSIIAFLGAFYFARGITRPLKSLTDGARAISNGDFDYPLKVEGKDEVGQLSESFGRMALNLKQREEEIKESRDYLKNLLETANDLIYTVDINGCFTYINPRIKDYGYTAGELMGKNFLTILTEKHRGTRFKKSIREKISQIYNVAIRKKDGVIRICRVSVSPLMDQAGVVTGLLATVRDRTKHEQTKANLKYLKEYSEKIVASIPSSLLVLDKDMNIKSVNRMYRKIGGIRDDDIVGKNIKEVFPDDLLKKRGLLKALDEVIETGETRRLYGIKHASSSHHEKILNITVSGIHRATATEEDAFIIIIEDVTERARMMEEIREKNKDLESFAYTISHDLRSPIVSVQGFSSILLSDFQDKLDNTGKRYLMRIQANVRQMEILIDDLLEFSRVGRLAGSFEDVSSAEIIRESLGVLGPRLKKRGIRMNVQSSLPVIHCEKIRIYQVFENLIRNSIKYIGNTENPVIEIGCKKTDRFHEFYVKDNGIGIDPEYHQRIFQMFQRLKEVDAKGTGVGLAIVERIAEVHGGSVRVESEKGKGATFYFTLPDEAHP